MVLLKVWLIFLFIKFIIPPTVRGLSINVIFYILIVCFTYFLDNLCDIIVFHYKLLPSIWLYQPFKKEGHNNSAQG